jgi:hypothetical protein
MEFLKFYVASFFLSQYNIMIDKRNETHIRNKCKVCCCEEGINAFLNLSTYIPMLGDRTPKECQIS